PAGLLPPVRAALTTLFESGARRQVPRVCAVRLVQSSGPRRGEALAGAPLDNAPKEYPPKIQQLVRDIASLTLLEISDLNELLKKTLKIQDVGLMPMGSSLPGAVPTTAAPAEAAEEVPRQKERSHFTVRLTEAKPVDKVKLIKEIKNYIQGINLVQAKKLVESLPQEIKANVAKAEAEKIKAALEATQQEARLGMLGMARRVVRSDGILALYSGLSASLCRQVRPRSPRPEATLTPARPAASSPISAPTWWARDRRRCPLLRPHGPGVSVIRGSQTLPPAGSPLGEEAAWRRLDPGSAPPCVPHSYSHALDGLFRVAREEGLRRLFSGATMASSRGMLVTVGQLSCYDQAKQLVLGTGFLSDGVLTHFVASFTAGGCATILCQPLDVLKTRLMSSKGEYQGVLHCALETAKLGPLAFYKSHTGSAPGQRGHHPASPLQRPPPHGPRGAP
ncbi:PREDICTED: 39S ribosomal protein L12, mitochondrial, partial [Condylura cristata]|uniref:39S ribosomal protein L12, mitochondrial n=1 Tax=Condylura cristata TaxID=143302 RepID=UPI0006438F0B